MLEKGFTSQYVYFISLPRDWCFQARAKIFGEELASEVAMPETRINTKAKYRGLDNSAYDPDYCRESTMLAPQYSPRGPMFTAPVYSNNLPSSYPSLHQAYGPHRPNS